MLPPHSHTPALAVRELALERGARRVFQGLDFALERGALLHVAGANGSGKTSLLRILAGLTTATAGEVRWYGAVRPAQCVNYVGHLDGLCAELSARENLAFVAALTARPSARERVTHALSCVAAQGYAEQPLRTLSSGQRRRIALARVVLLDAPLWLLDEPFTALDRANRLRLEALLDAHLSAGGSVVIATHQSFAGPRATQVITLEDYA